MLNIRIETVEEKQERIFNSYKNRLIEGSNGNIRFNVIECLCSFPKIDSYVMAASIKKDGITILYDDSAISKKENRRKEKQVNKLLS